VQFVEPWLIDPVIAYCRSQHDALPAEWQPIDVAADEKVWVARFDIELFGRYALLAHLLTHLEASRDAEAVIQVTSVGTDQPVQAPSRPFTRNDVGWDPYEFDVGVLLVHGIGPHVRGQTLVNFSDPLIKFIHGWFRGFNDWSASNYAGESGKLREAVETGPLANDPGHWGLREELERFTSQVRTDGKAGEATATGAPLFGSAQVSKVVLAQSPNEPDTPANAVIRLAVIDDAAAPREASVLLSEAWWAPATVPPTRQQLLDWVFRVLPLMVSSHITLPLRRAQRHRAAARSSLSQFIAACEEWLARIWVLFVFGPLSLLLCLAMQVLLSVLGAIAALPIPRLKAWLTPVLEWLMGAPGQSYVIVHSPVRRGSILSDVDRNLDWICSRCRKVIILAHSQGATAAHVVLTNKGAQQFPREEAIRQLITVGSGIRKLKMLEAEGSTGFPSFCVNAIFVLFAVLGLLRWQQENWVWLLDLLHPQHSWLAQALDPSNDIRIVVGALLLASIAFILYGEAAGILAVGS
jgi:hypothetical protein